MTSLACISGTACPEEIAQQLSDIDILVHIPCNAEATRLAVAQATELLEQNPQIQMATLATPIRSREELEDSDCVKVAIDGSGQALYFSRSPIPCAQNWDDELLCADPPLFHRHIGVYAYRCGFLIRLAALPKRPLETLEDLEQLRALEHGFSISVAVVDEQPEVAEYKDESS